MSKKLILFIGGTGAQGIPAIKALLSPGKNGEPSPYAVRVVTRDPSNWRAVELQDLGCELVTGSVKDLPSIHNALEGVYGAFVNTDGFTIGEKEELFAAFRIYELAKERGVKHYVWSNLDYMSKKGNFDPKYRCGHYDAKGRVADFLRAQPSARTVEEGTVWSILTSGPYMDMLVNGLFLPRRQPDDSLVWDLPLGQGKVPLIALSDFGFFTRHIFDNPTKYSGVDLEVASEMVSFDQVVETFERVVGKEKNIKAVYKAVTLDEYFEKRGGGTFPAAKEAPEGLTFRQNFTGFFNGFKDGIVKRDMAMLKEIHPGLLSLEAWMKEVGYDGTGRPLLKNLDHLGGKSRF
ncbi:NAD(P)-binding protein [Serendipita vermifera]|nr:NAD(P)-binding protein [Serendipita vermifera]